MIELYRARVACADMCGRERESTPEPTANLRTPEVVDLCTPTPLVLPVSMTPPLPLQTPTPTPPAKSPLRSPPPLVRAHRTMSPLPPIAFKARRGKILRLQCDMRDTPPVIETITECDWECFLRDPIQSL